MTRSSCNAHKDKESIAQLVDLGFDEQQAINALQQYGNIDDAAANLLLPLDDPAASNSNNNVEPSAIAPYSNDAAGTEIVPTSNTNDDGFNSFINNLQVQMALRESLNVPITFDTILATASSLSQPSATLPPGVTFPLPNIGNSCYMNSIMQCLARLDMLIGPLMGGSFVKDLNARNTFGSVNCNAAIAFARLLRSMFLSPNAEDRMHDLCVLMSALGEKHSHYNYGRQEDGNDFLQDLQDLVKEDININDATARRTSSVQDDDQPNGDLTTAVRVQQETNNSIVDEALTGFFQCEKTCPSCQISSVKLDPFQCIQVPLPLTSQNTTLGECFSAFFNGEDDQTTYTCKACKEHVNATSKISVAVAPPVLIVQLKRFKHIRNRNGNGPRHKLNNLVDIHLNLELHLATKSLVNYKLYAVVLHAGGCDGGHYTSVVLCRDGKWRHYNDGIDPVVWDENQVRDKISRDGYMAFFVRDDVDMGALDLSRVISASELPAVVPKKNDIEMYTSNELDELSRRGVAVRGMRVKVMFDDVWYFGTVESVQNKNGRYEMHVKYDNGDEGVEQYPGKPGEDIELLGSGRSVYATSSGVGGVLVSGSDGLLTSSSSGDDSSIDTPAMSIDNDTSTGGDDEYRMSDDETADTDDEADTDDDDDDDDDDDASSQLVATTTREVSVRVTIQGELVAPDDKLSAVIERQQKVKVILALESDDDDNLDADDNTCSFDEEAPVTKKKKKKKTKKKKTTKQRKEQSKRSSKRKRGCIQDESSSSLQDESSSSASTAASVPTSSAANADAFFQEQLKFTKCEEVFLPMMEKLTKAKDDSNVKRVLECINAINERVDLLTPPFLRGYPLGILVKQVRKAFEVEHPEVKKHCKSLSAEMRRVYNEKDVNVPEEFEAVKNWKKHYNLCDSDGNVLPIDVTLASILFSKVELGAVKDDGRLPIVSSKYLALVKNARNLSCYHDDRTVWREKDDDMPLDVTKAGGRKKVIDLILRDMKQMKTDTTEFYAMLKLKCATEDTNLESWTCDEDVEMTDNATYRSVLTINTSIPETNITYGNGMRARIMQIRPNCRRTACGEHCEHTRRLEVEANVEIIDIVTEYCKDIDVPFLLLGFGGDGVKPLFQSLNHVKEGRSIVPNGPHPSCLNSFFPKKDEKDCPRATNPFHQHYHSFYCPFWQLLSSSLVAC